MITVSAGGQGVVGTTGLLVVEAQSVHGSYDFELVVAVDDDTHCDHGSVLDFVVDEDDAQVDHTGSVVVDFEVVVVLLDELTGAQLDQSSPADEVVRVSAETEDKKRVALDPRTSDEDSILAR